MTQGLSKNQRRGRVAGVDVGGTFTDLVIFDPASGAVELAKVPTTLPNQAGGVLAAFASVNADLSAIDLIVHGTTTTTNAVLERQLARTGLITTTGFRDLLELGRRTRPQAYGMHGRFVPIIPRDLRLEIPERMDARGRVITPLDEDALRAAVLALQGAGCESLVIHFLHAYANPAHELRAGRIAAILWPNHHITLGHALLSESREYERGVTAAVNASVQPLLERYVARLAKQLAAKGYARDLLVMNGNGGMVSARDVAREAVKTVMSGPASGVMAALATGRRAGMANLLTYDMGGTSTDVAMIRNGVAPASNEIELEYAMPIHVPMVDVRTVGAGGGSIARIDAGGMLRALAVTKTGDGLTFDFAGSSDPCQGPMNSVRATTLSSVYLAMRHIFPEVPISAGAFEPLVVTGIDGTFLDVDYPRPVSGCAAEVSQRIAEAVFVALVQALPALVTAAPAGTSGNFGLGGHDPDKGRDYVMYQISGGGYGGFAHGDGIANGCSTIGISKAPPVEIMEQNYPILYHRYALHEGSGGAGQHRGGFGLDYEIELLRGQARASFVMDHGRTGPPGVLGGQAGAVNRVEVIRGDTVLIPEHLSKAQDIVLNPGDRVRVRTPGGGGYGDPALRDPGLVAEDLALGRYSPADAARLWPKDG